jgi:hypothetical protein
MKPASCYESRNFSTDGGNPPTKDIKKKKHLQLLQTILSFNKYEKNLDSNVTKYRNRARFVNISYNTYKLRQLGNFLPIEKTIKKSPKYKSFCLGYF